jgi:hypothetical protein
MNTQLKHSKPNFLLFFLFLTHTNPKQLATVPKSLCGKTQPAMVIQTQITHPDKEFRPARISMVLSQLLDLSFVIQGTIFR